MKRAVGRRMSVVVGDAEVMLKIDAQLKGWRA
jgi:hypothetical protein